MTTPTVAANAYSVLAKLHDPGGAIAKSAGTEPSGGGFGDMLKNAISSLNQSAKHSDAQTQAMAAGKANIVDVVTAVAETEVAIDALVSVRDRVIHSYEEIMKMPI
jgi:flagellar hook-basal body complex protein FliE